MQNLFTFEKKFDKTIFKKYNLRTDNIANNSLLKRLFNFHVAFSDSDRRRSVVEAKF